MARAQLRKFIVGFKLLGAVFIIASTSIYGYCLSLIPAKRYKNLVKILSGIEILENEITFSKDTIDEIFIKIATLIECDCIFRTVTQRNKGECLFKGWKRAVFQDKEKLCLKASDCEVISMLGAELGITDVQGQIKNILHIKELLKKQIEESLDEKKRTSRLYKSMGVALGVFAAVLLM